MKIFTDTTEFAHNILDLHKTPQNYNNDDIPGFVRHFLDPQLTKIYVTPDINFWKYCLIIRHAQYSQFEYLARLLKQNKGIPAPMLIVSKTGENFKGFRNRTWITAAGNLHLTVFLQPQQKVKYFHSGFLIIAALSVINVLAEYPVLKKRTGIKWVNDILIDGKKVGGILSHTQSAGQVVNNAILGIGINIFEEPAVVPDKYVHGITTISEHTDTTFRDVFAGLIHKLKQNYFIFMNGHYNRLLEMYKKHSLIINKEITVFSDPMNGKIKKIHHGILKDIGMNLELIFEDRIIYNGRIVF